MSSSDTSWDAKLEEFAKLQMDLERRTGSLSGSQLFALIGAFVILVFFLGSVAVLVPAPFGTIFASVLTSLAVIRSINGMRSSNIRTFLELQKEAIEGSSQANGAV